MKSIGLCVTVLAAAVACSQGATSSPSPLPSVPSLPAPSPTRPDIPGYDQRWQLTTVATDSSACVAAGRPLPLRNKTSATRNSRERSHRT